MTTPRTVLSAWWVLVTVAAVGVSWAEDRGAGEGLGAGLNHRPERNAAGAGFELRQQDYDLFYQTSRKVDLSGY